MLLFLDATGPLRGRPSHRARLAGAALFFLDGAGPLLGPALHLAGLARTSALCTISSARRTFYALLGRGQAAAGDQGRTRNRSQHSFSHLKSPSLVANCRT